MVRSCRRYFLPAALVLMILLVSAGSRVATPATDAQAAFGSSPLFDPLDVYDTTDFPLPINMPPRLLAGTNSHALPANALTRNGYCLDVNIDDITPAPAFAANRGFRIFAKNPIDPDDPPTVEVPIPTGGTYLTAPNTYGPVGPLAGTATNFDALGTSDDVYCVVAFAQPGYRNLVVEWHYQVGGDGSDTAIALPDIPIVNVGLQKIGDGLVGAPAEVCTVGWDSTFLTGRISNFAVGNENDPNPATSDPTVFDPVNEVDVADFIITNNGGNGSTNIAYVRQVGTEWCAGIDAPSPGASGVEVAFAFDAVYSRSDVGVLPNLVRDKDVDDQPVPGNSITLPPGVTVDIVDSVELRHVTIDGQVPPRQRSAPLVIGFTHYICLIGTDLNDSLQPGGIQFTPLGAPDTAQPTAVNIFHKSPANDDRLNGVTDDTLCFSFTSPSPGEHTVSVEFSNNGVQDFAFFDTNQDGNGIQDSGLGPLVTQWNRIDRTEITRGGLPGTNTVTFTTINTNLAFNVADGTYIGGAGFTEWVIGSHNIGTQGTNNLLLDGANIRAEIIGTCGYFEVPNTSPPTVPTPRPTVITGISVGGRLELNAGDQDPFSPFIGDEDASPDDISFSTVNDGGCTPHSTVTIRVDVFYPGQNTPAVEQEWVRLTFSFIPPQKQPRVAWAGQYVSITYAFSGDCDEQATVHFVRPENQPGSFIPDDGISLNGPNHATTPFGDECSATVRYESEDAGEVDVEVFLEGNEFSKFAVPIYFIVFEDVVIDATPDQFVSTFGSVDAQVRGWFPGSNPSGREAEVKPDGRVVPADRWVLPDDWNLLRGSSEFRSQGLTMPSAIVTFAMFNEPVRNSYKPPVVTTGSSGFFIPDTIDDYSFNVNPHTGAVTKLGSLDKPRMMSDPTDAGGRASVATFGDLNLTYEECPANAITGNPHCEFEDVVGHGRYIAYVEYPVPENRGKWPAIASNVAETVWRWAGYKQVSIVDTASPQLKYVVAHLRDRDGFCDAANYNNVLGVPVDFFIDAGDGIILEAADRPYTISNGKRFATATTYDTLDFNGNPINTAIAKPTIMEDECQAWILVSNSLLGATNIMVTFPAPPSPLPGDVRLTGVQCISGPGTAESFTVTNAGTKPVSLAGFGLQSPGGVGIAQHLDLIGYLEPGASKTFPGGPNLGSKGWIGGGTSVLGGAGDFVQLTWDDFVVSTGLCNGQITHNDLPDKFPLDPEGEIVIDVVIDWVNQDQVNLVEGWNLVPTGTDVITVEEAITGVEEDILVIYAWDADLQEWLRYIPGAPDGVNTLSEFGGGRVYWVQVKRPLTLVLPD